MMKRTLGVGMAAVMSLTGLSAALQAAELKSQFDKDRVISALHEKGIEADSVETWSNLIRAFVRQPDGSLTMQFFQPDTLKPVHMGN